MADPDGDWSHRIRSIAESLLTVEVNTIEKDNMSAAKMPDVPLALHQIARLYLDALAGRKCFVTDELLALAQGRIDNGEDPARLDALQAWRPADGDSESVATTNGPKTFEALQWVALAARRQLDEHAVPGVEVATDRTLFTRMIINTRQLRQMSLMMLQQHNDLAGAAQLFDGTIEATTAAMFRRPRPNLDIDADILLLVRKIWDIGLEKVAFQTSMQIDGDVLVRVSPNIGPNTRAFLGELHRSTVETALRQWNGLFALVGSLVTGVGRSLFGPRT